MSEKTLVAPFEVALRYAGRVKWFNNKSGFGFITVHDPSREVPYDLFVHHSAIRVSDEQFRYIIQGEYVEFHVEEVTDKAHKYHAIDVTGMFEGRLMCETKHEFRQHKTEYQRKK
jgi:cold shock CspA family protein